MTGLHVPDVTGLDMLGAALAYAGAGWYVVPTRAGTKNPGSVVGSGWEQKSSRDPRLITSWYAGTDHGIALHAGRSGAVVLDIDQPVPSPELDAFLALLTECGAPVQRTDRANTRHHALVAMPAGRMIGNSSAGLRVGGSVIDVRGLNGVIIVAPTAHMKPDGEYAWQRIGAVPACPPEIAEQLADTKAAPTALRTGAAQAWLDAMIEGAQCPHTERLLALHLDRLTGADAGYRHENTKTGVRALIGAAGEGHRGVHGALTVLSTALKRAAGGERDTDREFDALLDWAVACQVPETPQPFHVDMCAPAPLAAPPMAAALTLPPPSPTRHPTTLTVTPGVTLEAFVGELLALPEEKRAERAREIVPTLVDLPAGERQAWRTGLADYAGLLRGDFNEIVKSVRDARKAQLMAEREDRRAAEKELRRDQLMSGPHAPLEAARDLAARLPHTDGVAHARWWRGDFYRFIGAQYRTWPDDSVESWVYRECGAAAYEDEEGEVVDWNPGPQRVNGVIHALGRSVLYRESDDEAEDSPDAIACANGVLTPHGLMPHHPARFNLHALPFAYDPAAACPAWEAFLESALPGDGGAQRFVREWFGYTLSGRTDLQKIASFFGVKRSGKGTIARVLTALLGAEVVTSPTLEKLATQFSEAPLIGKRLAILSDVRWNARATAEAVPILLAISGEDGRSVPRKNRSDWNGKLPARFLVMSNDAPMFADASGALASRMIHVRFRVSFYGREDLTLLDRLLGELPGILNWALAGLRDLDARGRFLPPESSVEADEQVRRMASPVGAFLMDRTELIRSGEASIRELYAAYRTWAQQEEGRTIIPPMQQFGAMVDSALGVAYPTAALTLSRRRWDGTRTYQSRFIEGLGLLPAVVDSGAPGAGSGAGLVQALVQAGHRL